jgi:Tol biopolymer transport system component
MSARATESRESAARASRIAFSLPLAERTQQVFSVNPDGGELQRLTGDDGQSGNWSPVWSPDGSRLCFTSNRTGHVCLWLMAADGSDH